jgi:hypothetical protein
MRAVYSVGFILCGSTLFLLMVIMIFAARQPGGTHAPVQVAVVSGIVYWKLQCTRVFTQNFKRQTAWTSIEDLRADMDEITGFSTIAHRPQVHSSTNHKNNRKLRCEGRPSHVDSSYEF